MHWFENFCNIAYVIHLPEAIHNCCRNVQKAWYVPNRLYEFLHVTCICWFRYLFHSHPIIILKHVGTRKSLSMYNLEANDFYVFFLYF